MGNLIALRKKSFFALSFGVFALFISFAPHTFAADPPATAPPAAGAQPTTTTADETAKQYADRILKDAPATLDRCGLSGTTGILYYYCGGTALADGTDYYGIANFRVDYKKGDVIKCYIANATLKDTASVCAITSGGVTTYKEGFFSGASQSCDSAGTCSDSGAVANSVSNAVQTVTGDSGTGCSANPLTWGTCFMRAVGDLILTFANLLLGIAGALLNWVVLKTVFQFGSLIGNSPGLLVAWGIMRDLGNMLLLFGFIFMGLMTILDLHSFPTRKAIPQLIVFAILMNFSLFAAEAIIDTSNALTSVVYSQTNTDPCGNIGGGLLGAGGASSENADCVVDYGLAGHIMQSTGLASLFKVSGSFSAQVATYIGLALFSTIGAVVMFAASIMLVTRVVVLSFIMVAAPIGFAGMAIPPLRKFANKWWGSLLSQSFFAPVLFLLIMVSLKITDSFAGAGTRGSLAAALAGTDSGAMGIIMIFVIVIGFLIMSLIVAKNMGAAGAGFAIEKAGGVVYGTGGWAGRNVFGRASNNVNDRIRKSSFGQTRIGRRVATLTEKGAKGSYDFRGTKLSGVITKQTGSMGKPEKDGYVGQIKRESEEYKKYAETLKQTDRSKGIEKGLKANQAEAQKRKAAVEKEKDSQQKAFAAKKKEAQDDIGRKQSTLKFDDESRKRALDLQQKKAEAAIGKENEKDEKDEFERMSARYAADREQQFADIKGIQDNIKAAEEAHNKNIEGFNKRIAEEDTYIKKVDKTLKGDMENGKAGFDKDSSKRAFGIKLKNSSLPFKGTSRKKAFEAIRGDLNKSKTDKALEEIKETIKHGGKDVEHQVEALVESTTKAGKDNAKAAADNHASDNHG